MVVVSLSHVSASPTRSTSQGGVPIVIVNIRVNRIEVGGHPVVRLDPLPGDRVHVAVQVHEAGADHQAGDVDVEVAQGSLELLAAA